MSDFLRITHVPVHMHMYTCECMLLVLCCYRLVLLKTTATLHYTDLEYGVVYYELCYKCLLIYSCSGLVQRMYSTFMLQLKCCTFPIYRKFFKKKLYCYCVLVLHTHHTHARAHTHTRTRTRTHTHTHTVYMRTCT